MVRLVRQCHDFPYGPAVAPAFVSFRNSLTCSSKLVEHGRVRQFRGQVAVKGFVDKAGAATCDVDELAHQVRVDPGLEIFQVQVQVVDIVVQLSGIVIPQILRVEVSHIGAGHDECAPGLGHFLAVNGDETVDPDSGGGAKSGTVELCGPEQGMEAGDVLANEMIEFALAVRAEIFIEVDSLAVT